MRDASVFRKVLLMIGATFLQLVVYGPLFAAPPETQETTADDSAQADPPERVARLSFVKGHVTFQSEDQGDWQDGTVNRPLTSGDRVRLDANSRAELQMGPVDVQLDERSVFSFLELTDDVAQLRLANGSLYLTVHRLRDGEVVEVDTPQAAISMTKPGEYSIAIVNERTVVRAYEGAAEVTDHSHTMTLKAREQASFAGPEHAEEQVAVTAAAPRGAFDSWAHERAQRVELAASASASAPKVAPDVIGSADLDEYGTWRSQPDYGPVWFPSHVAVDWSPYRYGHWAWIAPWGWTWIDDAPWGFAPFHYGRWATFNGVWGWVPGPVYVRPVYAPALVAWVGSSPPHFGFNFSVSFGSGIGWFPLAPHEVFVPSYYCGRRYFHGVNYANTTVVNNVYINRAYYDRSTHFNYVNRNVHNAVTVVKRDDFTGSRSVRNHMYRVDDRDLRNWNTHNSIPNSSPHGDRGGWKPGDKGGHDGKRNYDRDVMMRHTPMQTVARNGNDKDFNRGKFDPRSYDRRNGAPFDRNKDRTKEPWHGVNRGGTPRVDDGNRTGGSNQGKDGDRKFEPGQRGRDFDPGQGGRDHGFDGSPNRNQGRDQRNDGQGRDRKFDPPQNHDRKFDQPQNRDHGNNRGNDAPPPRTPPPMRENNRNPEKFQRHENETVQNDRRGGTGDPSGGYGQAGGLNRGGSGRYQPSGQTSGEHRYGGGSNYGQRQERTAQERTAQTSQPQYQQRQTQQFENRSGGGFNYGQRQERSAQFSQPQYQQRQTHQFENRSGGGFNAGQYQARSAQPSQSQHYQQQSRQSENRSGGNGRSHGNDRFR